MLSQFPWHSFLKLWQSCDNVLLYFKEACLDTYKIYVGNLAPETTDQDLRSKFGKCGPVIEDSARQRLWFCSYGQ